MAFDPHILMVLGSSERRVTIRTMYKFRAAALRAAAVKVREPAWIV
jgi:hypothetical protein